MHVREDIFQGLNNVYIMLISSHLHISMTRWSVEGRGGGALSQI